MSARRRGPSRPSTCKRCGAEVLWAWSFTGTTRRPFAPEALNGRDPALTGAHPVWAGRAWKPADLVAELMSLHKYREVDAIDEMRDLPHHRLHLCGYPSNGGTSS